MSNYDNIQNALNHIDPHDRETWFRMGAAIKDELGENGFEMWDNWSRQAENYKQTDAQAVWKSIKTGHIHIATLFKAARENGYQPDKPHTPPSLETLAQRAQIAQEKQRAETQRIEQEHQKATKTAYGIWQNAKPADPNHPYAQSKNLDSNALKGIRQNEYNGKHQLVIPLYSDKKLVNVQTIDEQGTKKFLNGGQKQGAYTIIGDLKQNQQGIVLAEGFATAASVHQATGKPVIVAFDAGNLKAVSEKLREVLPENVPVYFAADNDVSQTGLRKAQAAAEVWGERAKIMLPEFSQSQIQQYQHDKGADQMPSDFNDLHKLAGIEAVREQLSEIVPQTEIRQPEPEIVKPELSREELLKNNYWRVSNGLEPLPEHEPNQINPAATSEKDVAVSVSDKENEMNNEEFETDFSDREDDNNPPIGFEDYNFEDLPTERPVVTELNHEPEQEDVELETDNEPEQEDIELETDNEPEQEDIELETDNEPEQEESELETPNSIEYGGSAREQIAPKQDEEPELEPQNSIEYGGFEREQEKFEPENELPKPNFRQPENPEPKNEAKSPELAKPQAITDLSYDVPDHLKSRMVAVDTQRFRVANYEMGAHLLRYVSPENAKTVLFEDKGKSIHTARNDSQTIQDMLSVAQAKNWDSIKISGSPEFKQQMWLEAESRGIATKGYKPSPEDLALLENRRAQHSTNSIAEAEKLKQQSAVPKYHDSTTKTIPQEAVKAADTVQAHATQAQQTSTPKPSDTAKAKYESKLATLPTEQQHKARFYERQALAAMRHMPAEFHEKTRQAIYENQTDLIHNGKYHMSNPMKSMEKQPETAQEKTHERAPNRDDWEMER